MLADLLKWAVVIFGGLSAYNWYNASYPLPTQVTNREKVISGRGKTAALFAFLAVASQAALNFLN